MRNARILILLLPIICFIFTTATAQNVNQQRRNSKRVQQDFPPVINNLYLNQTLIIKPLSIKLRRGSVCEETDQSITVTTDASLVSDTGDRLLYIYKVSGGKIIGEGASVVWDLSDVKPGKYKIEARVDDGCGECDQPLAREIEVAECEICFPPSPSPCPTNYSITANREQIKAGETVIFTASGDFPPEVVTERVIYNWTISSGEIVSGQGTKNLTVRAKADTGEIITATAILGDLDASCQPASATVEVRKP